MATVLKDLQCLLIFAFFYDLFLTEDLRSHGFNTREVHGVKDLHYVRCPAPFSSTGHPGDCFTPVCTMRSPSFQQVHCVPPVALAQFNLSHVHLGNFQSFAIKNEQNLYMCFAAQIRFL